MSIVTKTGDRGTTALMFNRVVSKADPRVEACGAVDELNAALGLARASARDEFVRRAVEQVQPQLITLMGELATAPEDRTRFLQSGFTLVGGDLVAQVEKMVVELEARGQAARGWAIPGGGVSSATLDLARTICRRAERRVCGLQDGGQLQNPEILVYLNRLSDLLWLLARRADAEPAPSTPSV